MANNPTLRQLVSTLPKEQRICVIRNREAVYAGFVADIVDPLGVHPSNPIEHIMDHLVSKIVTDTEIRHKKWKENGYMPPLEPSETPDYEFKELEQKTYLKVYL